MRGKGLDVADEARNQTGNGGGGDYSLISDRDNSVNTRVREARLHTYHRMVLVVL